MMLRYFVCSKSNGLQETANPKISISSKASSKRFLFNTGSWYSWTGVSKKVGKRYSGLKWIINNLASINNSFFGFPVNRKAPTKIKVC